MNKLCIRLESITKTYNRPVLTGVNLSIDNGSFIAIIGKSGSGKSTLMNILGLVEEYTSGRYFFNGTEIKPKKDYAALRLQNIGFIFQSYNLIPTMTCRENILLPFLYSKSGADREAVLSGLAEVLGIGPLLDTRINVLSGGEKQRVAIARALVLDPAMIIADEPTGNLDAENREAVLSLLRAEHDKGRAVVVITHDADVASRADSVLELSGGVLRERSGQ